MNFKAVNASMRNWIDSAQEIDYCITLVNAALNLGVPKSLELFSRELSSYLEACTN